MAALLNPLILFWLSIWSSFALLAAVDFSTIFYRPGLEETALALLITISFSAGFACAFPRPEHSGTGNFAEPPPFHYSVVQGVLLSSVAIIVFVNFRLDGLPPIFRFLGENAEAYNRYGHFKALAFAELYASVVLALYCRRTLSAVLVITLSAVILIAYVARGPLMILLAQAAFAVLARYRIPTRVIAAVAIAGLVPIVVLFGVIGEYRAGTALFFSFFHLRAFLWDWPLSIVFFAVYVVQPWSDFLYIVHYVSNWSLGLWTYCAAMPAFFHSSYSCDLAAPPNVIDGVYTSSGTFYLDFGLAGVMGGNLVCGFLSGWVYVRRNGVAALFLPLVCAAAALAFFSQLLIYSATIIEAFLLAAVLVTLPSPRRSLQPDRCNSIL